MKWMFDLSSAPNHQKVEENMEPDANTFLTAQILNDGKLVSHASWPLPSDF